MAVSVVVVDWALLVNVRVALSAPATSGLYVTVNGTLCPAGTIAGSDRPLIAKRELLEVAAVTVTFVPVAVRLPEAVPLVPATTLPSAIGVGEAVSTPAVVVPVPARGIVSVGFVPFDVTVTEPLALVAVSGEKVTVKVAVCPAATVAGVVIPLRLKPVPLTATCEIVTLVPPVLVKVSESAWWVFVCTVPKFRLVGFAPNAPSASPVPDSAIDSVGLGASEVIVTLPLALPVAKGANVTVKVVLCAALSATGAVIPLSLNPVPLTEACEILTVDALLLVKVTVWALWVPTVTPPKLLLGGLSPS